MTCGTSLRMLGSARDTNFISSKAVYNLPIGNRCHRYGAGVQEIRVRTELEHRVFSVAKFEEAIYMLHAFEKKSRKAAGMMWNWPNRD
jgi:hypothetical protein